LESAYQERNRLEESDSGILAGIGPGAIQRFDGSAATFSNGRQANVKKAHAVLVGMGGFLMAGLLGWRWLVKREPVNLADMAQCGRCHKLLEVKAGLSLIEHLRADHKLDAETAINKVEEAYLREARLRRIL
jgi:hypothetical protein